MEGGHPRHGRRPGGRGHGARRQPGVHAAGGSGFADAFGSVGFKVSFASAPDETSAMADLILPDRTSWSRGATPSPAPGLMALQQPVMQPVPHFDAKQTGDVLLSVASRLGNDLGGATFYEYLRAAHQRLHTAAWATSRRRGARR